MQNEPVLKIDERGTKRWYLNGKRHREDGPAVIYSDGDVVYCKNGKYHRNDGPAIIYSDGEIEWWLKNKEYTFENYCKELNLSKEQILKLTLKYNL